MNVYRVQTYLMDDEGTYIPNFDAHVILAQDVEDAMDKMRILEIDNIEEVKLVTRLTFWSE